MDISTGPLELPGPRMASVGEHHDWYSITSSSDGTKLAAVADGGKIWTSTGPGATWTSKHILQSLVAEHRFLERRIKACRMCHQRLHLDLHRLWRHLNKDTLCGKHEILVGRHLLE